MYPVSQEFLDAIDSNTRKYYWTGTIESKDHTIYELSSEDIVKGSGYITRQCCSSSEIELGTVYTAELGLTLLLDIDRYTLDEAEIKLFFHLVLEDGTIESIPMGIFEVSEANRNIHCLELKGYDYMLRFDKSFKMNSSSGTAYNFLNIICKDCNVEMAQTKSEIDALPNGKEILGVYLDNDIETYRDLLFYVAGVLGCFCQINREGKLQLVAYSDVPTSTIDQKHRFDSSYSDFVTRYTAVSSTNLITEESEYYSLDIDDGLTLNLGVNPLLQFGLKKTRTRIITNILNAIAVVNYVPFDSTTIGNPALDIGDILIFTGGHADDTKISCVTSINYKINGKHTLKCVGKNPRLAAAKSKTDKNITGLLNQVEAGKIVVYNFANVSPYEISTSPTMILDITFTSKEDTTASFMAEILILIEADEVEKIINGTAIFKKEVIDEQGTTTTEEIEKPVQYKFTEKGHPELKITYKMNDSTIDNFYPTKTCIGGKQILTLFFPITKVVANSENTFSVYLEIAGGKINIPEAQIQATISGQGLVAGIGNWNGRIDITESIERIPIDTENFSYYNLQDNVIISSPEYGNLNLTQLIPKITLLDIGLTLDSLNERVTTTEIVKTFTIDKNYPPNYDHKYVTVNSTGSFSLINDYKVSSISKDINSGLLQELRLQTDCFEYIENMEVMEC